MSVKKKDRITDFFIFIFLSIGAVVMIAPLLWMVSTSLKSKEDVFALPPVWIPTDISFSKYTEIWSMGPLLSGISNSLIVALSVTIVGTFTSSLAAFAFAKLNFRGKNKIFLLLFASVMIPYPVLMIPQFMMFSSIGWVDTLLPLIVPGLFGNIFMIFFLRQFLNSIPNSIIEAAKIDGCSYFQIFYKIIFPLIKPAVAAQLILWFMAIWNDYLGPILYLNSPEKQTLQLVIANFNASYAIQSDYPLIMAASVVALLPMLLVFMIFQKQIIESIAISGVKG
ncbi:MULTISPECIES: carbohydrate ABC transporter permease [unclassified Exiguobacterium]|uniref:carbohydrate ABC transporter permease n=1 Tax=unclassified Exiguobacterium TaxID=2644629 RepID=UPI000A00507D|nr:MULTISPECIES: carbohydrate ABC transporter permease [unclassified Exiguobacterium]TCI36601.1 carbohydrate ABC transporter permease [Exiguobacterium sp. SH4S7]TCI57843.1 carbohydrate ABC transporter permease [Exiguobacterium sp. SH1S21]TCI63563.1 carbohydrate ABC transporter permease [Exiguobacterium sp. SH0S2]TCI71246.1 carbohydrate ABC transporter permease [Exiguobacterium sp. SH0S7]